MPGAAAKGEVMYCWPCGMCATASLYIDAFSFLASCTEVGIVHSHKSTQASKGMHIFLATFNSKYGIYSKELTNSLTPGCSERGLLPAK